MSQYFHPVFRGENPIIRVLNTYKGVKTMIKILFLCHGNICRSPMGEFILKDMVKKRGLSERFEIASAAVSTEEIGNPASGWMLVTAAI